MKAKVMLFRWEIRVSITGLTARRENCVTVFKQQVKLKRVSKWIIEDAQSL